jgi:hypothetical protein
MKIPGTGARLGIMMLLFLLMASVFVSIPKNVDEADAILRPIVTIRVDQKEAHVKVAPGQTGTVTFTGEVTASVPVEVRIQYLVVSLTYTVVGGVAVGTSQVIFPKGVTTQQISCNVKVPEMTSHQVIGQLTISGTWRYSPGSIQGPVTPDSASIYVDQYYLFSVGCDKSYVQVSPGDSIGYRLRLINEGNSQDKLKVEVKNLPSLIKQKWTVVLSQDQFVVPEKQEYPVTIGVSTPVKNIIWKNDVAMVSLRITSTQAESLSEIVIPSDYTLYIRQKGFQIPGFEPTFAIIAMVLLSTLLIGFARKRLS